MKSAFKKNVDFTSGNILLELIMFAIPLVAGELFQNLYSSVDSIVVGNFVGKNALAAVSVCSTLVNLVVGFFNGMSMGSSVVVSRAFGAKSGERLSETMRVAFNFAIILGVVLSGLGILLTPVLVGITDATPDIYEEAITYLRIYLAGIMFTVIYNISAGILRAIGDSSTPFTILVISACTNIVLDLVFVAFFGLGVAGVGFATIISQGLSVVLAYRKLKKLDNTFGINLKEILPNKDIILEVIGIGLPSGLQASLVSFSNIFVWRYINGFNSSATAGIGVAQRVDKFINLPCKAFGLTLTTFVSQNTGAGNYKRASQGAARCLGLSIAVTVALSMIICVFANFTVSLFNSEADVIQYGGDMLRVICPLYFIMSIREVYIGMLRGYGNTKVPMILSLIGMVAFRQIYLAIVMSIRHDINFIYWCYPLAWAVTTLLVFIYYRMVKHRYT